MKSAVKSTVKSTSKSSAKSAQLARKAFQVAKRVRAQAYAPYSKFRVGAAVVSGKKIFSGCNVENASFGATVCAERVAILKAVSEGCQKFSDVVVVTHLAKPVSPCALCLQVLCEFCKTNTRVWIANHKRVYEVVALGDLYPKAFGPRELKRAKKKQK